MKKSNPNKISFSSKYLREAASVIIRLRASDIEEIVRLLTRLKKRKGRLFILGVGGSAVNASHAAGDFRKIAAIEAYAPTDNICELTARTNDEGWKRTFSAWLKVSRLSARDMVMVFSVGGGDIRRNISPNIVEALRYAKQTGAAVAAVVGRNGGYAARVADACVIVPMVNPKAVTAHTEAFQAIIWHLLVSHPALQAHPMKWESLSK